MIARQGDILQTSFLFGGAVIALAAATLAVNAAADGDSARQLKLWGLIAWIYSVATPFGRRATLPRSSQSTWWPLAALRQALLAAKSKQ